MSVSRRLYRLFLRLYPAEFRERYGAPLERQFADELSEVDGGGALARLWLATVRDLATAIPAQLSREIAQDIRHTLRLWRRRPMPAACAIGILAIAMGANTGMFSVINALLLRALPFDQPERLAALHSYGPPRDTFDSWRHQSVYLSDAAMFDTTEVNVETASQAVRAPLAETSANFFALLGTRPATGRMFGEGEDAPGHNAVAVIGYGLWQRLYGGDAAAIGSSLRVNGVPMTIIGVAPARFDYPQRSEIWTPTTLDYERIPKTGSIIVWTTIGRLQPSISWTQARAAFEAEAFARAPGRRALDAINRPALTPLQEELAARVKPAALILLAGVGLLLVLACANVANLLLARTVARSNELAIRTALGASRGRLVQQLLTETMLMSLGAAAAGCAIARWSADLLQSIQPAALATQTYTVLDWRVLTFAALLSVATGLAFGVTPALFAGRSGAINQRTTTAATRHARMRNALIAAQIAATVALLSGSVALGRAFLTILRTDMGYDVESLDTLSVSLAGTPHDGSGAWLYFDDVFSRVRAVPGVSAVSATEELPLNAMGFMAGRFTLDGEGPTPLTFVVRVAPGFFSTMGTPILAGRDFVAADIGASPVLAVVDETLARRFGSPSSVVGRRLTADRWPAMQVVGVVRHVRYGADASESTPQAFIVSRAPHAMTIVARVHGPAADRLAAIRDAVRSIDPKVAVFDVKTMEEHFGTAVSRPRFYALAAIFFGGTGLLLSIIGVYGVVSFAVIQRTREMGVRLALGTTPLRLRAWMLRHTLAVVAAGSVAGVCLSMAFGRYLQSLIAGATGFGVSGSVAAVIATLVIASAAIWRATRHVARLDISDVLRAEAAE